MCDSLFLPVMTRRRVTFLAKNEYFTGADLKGRAKAAFVRGTGLIPLDRDDADAAAGALSTGARAVSDGRLLGVYPEGTRSPDGRLYRGKTGIARIALETGVPIVPVAMIGTDHVLPIGRSVPQLGRVEIRIGAPIRPPSPAAEGTPEAAGQARALTEQVMSGDRLPCPDRAAPTSTARRTSSSAGRQTQIARGVPDEHLRGDAGLPLIKPRLRGHLHQWGFVVSILTGGLLVALAPDRTRPGRGRRLRGQRHACCSAPAPCTTVAPGRSAVARSMKRLDHAMILVLIAGSYTPVVVLMLPADGHAVDALARSGGHGGRGGSPACSGPHPPVGARSRPTWSSPPSPCSPSRNCSPPAGRSPSR